MKVEKVTLNMELGDFLKNMQTLVNDRQQKREKPIHTFAELMEIENAKLCIKISK